MLTFSEASVCPHTEICFQRSRWCLVWITDRSVAKWEFVTHTHAHTQCTIVINSVKNSIQKTVAKTNANRKCAQILCRRVSILPVCWRSSADRHWYFYSRDSVSECPGLFFKMMWGPEVSAFWQFLSSQLYVLMNNWFLLFVPVWCMSNKYIPAPYFSAFQMFILHNWRC